MLKDGRLLFGSIIVIFLLALYGVALWDAIDLARTIPKPGETLPPLNSGTTWTLTTVGGLVSALVIAELAVTKPGDKFAGRFLVRSDPNTPAPGKLSTFFVTFITIAYVVVWVLLGFWAFVVGEMKFPDKVPALTSYAQAWLGLAVAAGYSYFSLEPPK